MMVSEASVSSVASARMCWEAENDEAGNVFVIIRFPAMQIRERERDSSLHFR